MKKIIIIYLLFCTCNTFFAQNETSTDRKNDIVLGPIELLSGQLVNVSYERLLNEYSGLGINALVSTGGKLLNGTTQFSPYYRYYFGNKYASGFFLEAFMPIVTRRVDLDGYVFGNYSSTISDDKKTSVGLGVGLGGKWVLRNNILIETSVGLGSGLDKSGLDALTGKLMLGIGYRF